MPSGKKCINVIVKLNENKYPSLLGYIPKNMEEELKEEVKKADAYKIGLYVNTEDNGKN